MSVTVSEVPLNRVLARVRGRAPARRPVAVFDLDSTLFSTQERNVAILHEFAARSQAAEALRRVVERIVPGDTGWDITNDLRRHGYDDEACLRELKRFWFERFFRSEYLHHDPPLPGAPEYVNEVHAAGAVVVYLTGRDEPGMGDGTRASLRRHRFPVDGDRVRTWLKPRFEEPDFDFKRRAVDDLPALGEVVAAFENEPANANLFCELFPGAEVVLLETVHSPDPPPLLPQVVRLRDYRR